MESFFISAEIMPPLKKNSMSSEIEDEIEYLSRCFDSFNIVTKPHRINSIAFFYNHVKKYGPATVHYAVGEKDKKEIEDDFQRAKECGVKSILIMGGDFPPDPIMRKLFASEAIEIAKSGDYGFACVGAALNPHARCSDNLESVRELHELNRLADKAKAGADCFFLQPTSDPDKVQEFLKRAKRYLYERNLDMQPVVEGIMIFDTTTGIKRARDVFGIPVKEDTEKEIMERGNNIESCMKLYQQIIGNGRYGVYFTPFSFSQYKILRKIASALKPIR